jgi:2-polyprenyl-6-methoxyphenol hydroxylase-like FAD-dependent oxidoreductase
MSKGVLVNRRLPVRGAYDVIVAGGGPAGIAAAVAAAREGARTALVERYGFLGGNATAGLVGPFMTAYSDDGTTQLVRGIFDELVRRMEAAGGAIHPEQVRAGSAYAGYFVRGHDHVTPFDPEALKLCAAEMMEEANVTLHLHTFLVDAVVEAPAEAGAPAGDTGAPGTGRAVRGVVIADKEGLGALRARLVVDCSADGDVAARAGVPMKQGRQGDGKTQPMTMFFRIANVDDAATDAWVEAHPEERGMLFHGIIEAARQRGEWTIPREKVGIYRTQQPGVWRVNTSRIQSLDGTRAADLTRAELEGRRQAWQLVAFFRRHLPGFANCILLDTATQVGVRETRRITGEYELTREDLITGRPFDDVVCLYAYPIDIHSPDGKGGGTKESPPIANAYQLPYRILVPVAVDGLLAAGRCVSATHEALAAIRVMPCAFALGQAAGTAAALALRTGAEPRGVNTAELQRRLLAQGVYLGPRFEPGGGIVAV